MCAPMFATYADRVVHTGPLGSAQAAKLVNNSLMTAITGLVFDAFDLGAALDVDRDRLGEILAHGSAANPSVGIYLAVGRRSVLVGSLAHAPQGRRPGEVAGHRHEDPAGHG